MELKQIFENNKKWVEKKLKEDKNYFSDLAKGQHPEILYIGCSDSRVSAEEIMGLHPSEVFVHRNIANMVPNTDLCVKSVINYSVVHLKVKHIIVCGHYECGGIKAAMQPTDFGVLNPWLRNIRDIYRLYKHEMSNISDENERYRRLIELNVKEQCFNIIKNTDVQKEHQIRELYVHGWIFDIASGKIIDLDIDFFKELKEEMEIYKLI